MSTLKKISIVIPIYNESENIIVLLKELLKILDTISGGEIIIVDDCSTDNGAELVLKHAEHRENIILIAHAKRLGQSACLLTAIKHSKNDIIITLDGDGQNDPEDIKNMLKIWEKEYKNSEFLLLIGNRIRRKDTFSKKLASRLALYIRKIILKDNTPDTGCGIKIFSKSTFLSLPYFDHIHRFLPALVNRQGGRVISIPVSHRARVGGKSKYSNWLRFRVGILDLWGVFWLIRRSPFPIKLIDKNIIKNNQEKE